MSQPDQILFLPGASGNTDFWKPIAGRLRTPVRSVEHVGWPGFGPTPADPAVRTLGDVAARVIARIDRPTALAGQSMGAVVALLAALARPRLVTHLIVAALSGGIDMARHGARDWRDPDPAIRAQHLFAAYDEDLSSRLPSIAGPVLLLWGDSDPVSPVAVGRWLEQVLPRSRMHVFAHGTHTFVNERPHEVAPLVDAHLTDTC